MYEQKFYKIAQTIVCWSRNGQVDVLVWTEALRLVIVGEEC